VYVGLLEQLPLAMVVAPIMRRNDQAACFQPKKGAFGFVMVYTGVSPNSYIPWLTNDVFGEMFKIF
jgi:hypothetical protein